MVDEWTSDVYKQNVRSIAAQWNFNVAQNTGQYLLDPKEIGLPLRWTERAILWRDYYLGRQKNIDYDSQLMNEDGTRKALKMFRGKDIFKFVNYSLDQCLDTINQIPNVITAKGLSDNIVSARKTQLNLQKFATDSRNAQFLESLAQQFGVYFQTVSGKLATSDMAAQLQSEDFIEGLEKAATNIGKDIFYRNNLDEVLKEAAKDALITGFGGTKTSIVNGYTLIENVPSTEAIFPPMASNDQHRYDPFGGRIRFLTVPEIFARYPELSQEDKTEIQNMSYNTTWEGPFFNYYNNTIGNPNFYWWAGSGGVMRVAVVECQWASYEKTQADNYRQCLREAVLIGNKYLLRHGISKNQTEDWKNPGQTNLDYQFVQPMSVFGYNMGMPEILYTYQNLVDSYQTKVNELVARSKGKVYTFNASVMGGLGKHASDIAAELAQNGITVVTGVNPETGPQSTRIVESIDMTLDPGVIPMMQQIREYKGMMADILNIPDAARGQLKGYQTSENVKGQIAQSNKGTSYFYDPFNTFLKRVMQKGVDKFKVATLDNPDIEYTLIVSDSEIETFKATKQFGLSKFSIHIDFADMVDEQFKSTMQQMVFGYVQNSQVTGYTMTDLIKVQSFDTKSEIVNYIEFRDAQIAQQKEQERMQAQQLQQQQMATQQQTQQNVAAINNQGANQRLAAQLDNKEATTVAEIAHERDMATADQPA